MERTMNFGLHTFGDERELLYYRIYQIQEKLFPHLLPHASTNDNQVQC